MKGKLNKIFLDRSIKYSILLSSLIIFFQTIILLLSYRFLPPVVPLFNSLPWGEDRLIKKEIIFILPASIILLILINTYFIDRFISKRMILSRMLAANVLLFAAISGIAILQIFILVF